MMEQNALASWNEQRALPTATLASQLKALEKDGLITRHVYAEVPPRVEYTLTDMGRRFGPVLSSIETWGNEYIAYLRTQK